MAGSPDQSRGDRPFTFTWIQRYIMIVITLAAIIFWYATKLGIVLFIAVLVTLLILPLRKALERRCSRASASLLAVLLLLAVAAAFCTWIVRTIVPSFSLFVRNIPELIRPEVILAVMNSLNLPLEVTVYVEQVLNGAAAFAVDVVKHSVNPIVNALSGIVELVGVPLIVFYFLKDGVNLCNMAFSYAPPQERPGLFRVAKEFATILGAYIKGQLTVCLFSGIAVFIYFLVTGLPFAPVFAALAAVGELIPVVGPLAASAVAVALCLGKSVAFAIQTTLFYVILLKVNHNFVSPSLIGKAVNVHPVLIMIGILFFGHLFGILGMVMAVPLIGVGRVVLREFLPQHHQ